MALTAGSQEARSRVVGYGICNQFRYVRSEELNMADGGPGRIGGACGSADRTEFNLFVNYKQPSPSIVGRVGVSVHYCWH